MIKGSMTLDDAQIVHDFARDVQPILHYYSQERFVKLAKTCVRISYCTMADARAKARAERARAQHNFDDPYLTEVIE